MRLPDFRRMVWITNRFSVNHYQKSRIVNLIKKDLLLARHKGHEISLKVEPIDRNESTVAHHSEVGIVRQHGKSTGSRVQLMRDD